MCDKKGEDVRSKDKEGDIMSATATKFVYRAIVPKGKEDKIPAISKEKLEEFKADVAKYRHKK